MLNKKKRYQPIRMCCVCRNHKEKDMLVRFVSLNGKIIIDTEYKHQSRGAYICQNIECFENAKKKKTLNKVFKQNLSEQDYDNFHDDFINFIKKNNKL